MNSACIGWGLLPPFNTNTIAHNETGRLPTPPRFMGLLRGWWGQTACYPPVGDAPVERPVSLSHCTRDVRGGTGYAVFRTSATAPRLWDNGHG